jgi:hypothetical protein
VAPDERPQGADQRGVGKLTVRLLDRLATQHEDIVVLGHPALELTDQTGLAHARVAGEQHHDRVLLGCFT